MVVFVERKLGGRMKKFSFRLEKLQRLRERLRDQRKIALAEAVQYQDRVERQISQIQHARQFEKEELRQSLSRRNLSAETAIQSQLFDGLLGRYEMQLDCQLKQVEAVAEQRRGQLLDAEKNVRVLEKLEGKLRQRHGESIESAERILMDELAQIADGRRRLGEESIPHQVEFS